jgi:PAS domain S-box-containing protein
MPDDQSAVRPIARQFTRDYLLASLLPLLLLIVSTTVGATIAKNTLARMIDASTWEVNRDANHHIRSSGEKTIERQAQAVARQVEIFLRDHPRETIDSLQRDETFQAIAVQLVGDTGYTCVYEAGSGIMRFHPNPKLIDLRMASLAPQLPTWWSIFEPSLSRIESSGYYEWIDNDGARREKYMSMVPVAVPIEERYLMVAATTYIEEFSKPLLELEKKAQQVSGRYRQFVLRQAALIGGAHLAVLLMTFGSVALVGRRAQRRFIRPIQALAHAAQQLGAGRWETEVGATLLRRQDEIGLLAQEFSRMQAQLKKLFTDLELRLAELNTTQQALQQSELHYRQLYQKAEQAREVYHSLLSSSADAIVTHDLDGRATYVSPSFSRMFGWSPKALLGGPIPFVPDSEREASRTLIETPARQGTAVQGVKTRRMTQDGRSLAVSVSASRFNDHRGEPAGILEVIRDITDHERLEEQFFRAQKMEAVGTLAGGIAHDFNNLMMGIQGNASLILLDLDPDHPHSERLKNIERYVQDGAELTRQLLGFARGGKYEVTSTDLNLLIEHNTRMFGRTHKEIQIHCRLSPDLWPVEVDRGQMEQMLLNLYVNAWQAMPDGGQLIVTTGNVANSDRGFEGPGARPGRLVKVSVTDTGIGMDDATRQRIFEPFFTTKPMGRGTGLGLSSVYGIVHHHGGLIEVASQKGVGTTFDVYLPASDQAVAHERPAQTALLKGSETVLLVDDEEMIVSVGSAMLEKLGYRAITARSGAEALALFAQQASLIDLVILDMVLPDMNGGEIFDRLRAQHTSLRVLLASGYSVDGQAREVLARGGSGFIQKPFSIEALSQKLREVLGTP